VLSFQQSSG